MNFRLVPNIDSEINHVALKSAIEFIEKQDKPWAQANVCFNSILAQNIVLCSQGRAVIERAAKTNGLSLMEDLPLVELAVMGMNFPGTFWDPAKHLVQAAS